MRVIASTLAIASLATSTGGSAVSGVPPALQRHYLDANSFKCITTATEIDGAKVNDDVCDCADGTDEPGTSACANGRFYCRNAGFKPQTLDSCFVGDGVCDCCDGSDEPRGCNNVCHVLGQEEITHLKFKLRQAELGIAARAKAVTQGQVKKAQWASEAAKAEKSVAELKPLADALNEKRDSMQAEVTRFEAALKGSLLATDSAAEADAEASADASLADDYSDIDPNSLPEYSEENDAEEADEEEVARRIAAQWTSDPAAAGVPAEDSTNAGATPVAADAAAAATNAGPASPDAATAAPIASDSPAGAEFGNLGGTFKRVRSAIKALIGGSDQAQTSDEVAKITAQVAELKVSVATAQKEAQLKNSELKKAETSLTTLHAQQAQEYGPDEAFAHMQGECYELTIEKYVYRVCPFGQATQQDGGSKTSLGTFSSFSHDFAVMHFTNGQACWQGPARSIRVELSCGPVNKLLTVEEPSRCTYTATMMSPALCSSSTVATVQAALRQLSGDPGDAPVADAPVPHEDL